MRQKNQVRFLRMVAVLAAMGMLAVGGVGAPPAAEAYTFPSGSDFVNVGVGISSDPNSNGDRQSESINKLGESKFASAELQKSGKFPYYTFFDTSVSYIEYSGAAKAMANAPTGSLKVYAQADGVKWLGYPEPATFTPGGCWASGYAFIRDSLYLDWPNTVTDKFPVTIYWDVFGSYTSTYAGSQATTRFNAALGGPILTPLEDLTDDLKDGKSALSRTFQVDPKNDSHHLINLLAELAVNVRLGEANFYHTGTFCLDLPPEVTFISASGVFLTDTGPGPSPTPLPGTLLLVGSGLAGILGLSRRRQLL